jgi:acetolactate synthase I/III small subunit
MSEQQMHTISLYVANKPGVLARIAQVFARRGFNIDSLVVSSAMDGNYSRMTISAKGRADGLDQIIKQASKLIDVIHCIDHATEDVVAKEMALVKVGVDSGERSEVLQLVEHFGCKVVDFTETSLMIMVTGDSGKLDALIRMLSKFRVVELVRTGKVIMARGEGVT